MIIVLRPPETIDGSPAPFVSVDGLASKAIVTYSGTTSWAAASVLTSGMDWALRYDAGLGKFVQVPILTTFYPITEPFFGEDVTGDVGKVFTWPERLTSTTFKLKEYSLDTDRASVDDYVWNSCDPGPTCDLGFRWDTALYLGARVQPFMLSIIMMGLDTAYEATVAAGDPDERLPTMISDAAKWLVDYGYDPLTGGLYFARSNPGCEAASDYGEMPNVMTYDTFGAGVSTPLAGCFSNVDGARAMSAEVGRAMSKAFVRESDSTRKTNIRNWMYKVLGKAYGKDGYDCAANYVAHCDGDYFVALEETYIGGFSYQFDKYLGFALGFGNDMAWPAADLHTEWPRTVTTRDVSIGFNLANVTDATSVKVTIKDPAGIEGTPVECETSPCVVTLDDYQAGNGLYKIGYYKTSGTVLLVEGQYQRLTNP
jgi:hypothetical protein